MRFITKSKCENTSMERSVRKAKIHDRKIVIKEYSVVDNLINYVLNLSYFFITKIVRVKL